MSDPSIFQKYYTNEPFIDRFEKDKEHAIDVIIPVVHTNELWESNLRSIYREIPVNRLLIADGGCIDNSLDIVKKFPRVEVFDHRGIKTLGYSIRKLIESVNTEWFVYVHSDVYLPKGWFDVMQKAQEEYDWFGCPMKHTVMVEYDGDFGQRPWAGSQMGRKKAFETYLSSVDDDFVYRQEDFVFADIVKKAGYKEGKVEGTFHYHQTMHKPTPWARRVKSVNIDVELSPEEEVRTYTMQLRGIVKYLQPSEWAEWQLKHSLFRLLELNEINWNEFKEWVKKVNPVWLPYVSKRWLLRKKFGAFLRTMYFAIFK